MFLNDILCILTYHISNHLLRQSTIVISFQTLDQPFHITFFISSQLKHDFPVTHFTHWLTSLSNSIVTQVFDPFQFPEKSDYFDIESDGMIIIEHDDHRQDINIFEHMMLNHEQYIETIQSDIIQSMIQLSNKKQPKVLLIHANQDALLDDTSPLGLNEFHLLFKDNFIAIDERSINGNFMIESTDYDLIILYKLSNLSTLHYQRINDLLAIVESQLIFNHPKQSEFTNLFDIPIIFDDAIIEDPTDSLIHSDTQLIVDYLSSKHQPLLGIFPYSAPIISSAAVESSIIITGDDAFIDDQSSRLNGPFSIAYATSNFNQVFINNYLTPTNFWIHQGDNYKILADIISNLLTMSPSFSASNHTHTQIIHSWKTFFILSLFLLIFPR